MDGVLVAAGSRLDSLGQVEGGGGVGGVARAAVPGVDGVRGGLVNEVAGQ